MALSRLENFLKSSRGKILHVNPENLDSSDSITNDGSSPFTPFKTINRALIEASRYSYQVGLNNDRFNFCTILVYSGEHFVDNRPGAVIDDSGSTYLRNGSSITLNQFDLNTILDLTDATNSLYLLNSVHGGVIVPRGTSIIAQDLRKTIIRPLYVPDPINENIERSSIFRITGASFFYGFSILDANPGNFCYKNYNPSKFTPNFSHHKLTAFEYVDGVNDVEIDDTFLTVTTTRTDLQQYYEKISLIYGESSGREIDNVTYVGGVSVDIQPIIDEYRIVGSRGDQVGISSIISGDGTTPSEVITVTLDGTVEGISVDTSVQISGVNQNGYDGQFVVSQVPSNNQIKYITSNIPTIASPPVFGATLNIISDTISSASPYVFNISLRSVYGMCGLHADGSKVGGFKSVVVAQFTGVSLQKDNNAFVIYDEESGNYVDSSVTPDLYKNTRAKYKPDFENYHIKVSNDSFAQLVSVFTIGYAKQIVAESGGDYSVTNSNSNFGAKSFVSSGYRKDSFDQDDHGYIIGIVPPQEIDDTILNIEFSQIDVGITTIAAAGAATTDKLYLYGERNFNNPPTTVIDGFRIGAKQNEVLYIKSPSEASSSVIIPGTANSYEKSFTVQRQNNNFENAITNGVITLTSVHTFSAGEKVRVFSQNGHLPDGVDGNKIYYVINTSVDNTLNTVQIKLATTFNNAINDIPILPNRKGGKLSITSRVYDKFPGELGHPVQWDSNRNNWYITVDSSRNGIYSAIRNVVDPVTLAPIRIPTSGRTFVQRIPDKRVEENKLFKLIYSIPKTTRTIARPPVNGFIIQESNSSNLFGTEFSRYFGTTDLASDNEIRNPKFIVSASWGSSEVTITTELPHKLNVGSEIEVVNVSPSGYNGTYEVIRVPSSRSFVYSLESNPGIFENDTRVRTTSLPYVKTKNSRNIFQIYKSKEIQEYVQDKQDGVYELTVVHCSVSPTISPFIDENYSQPLKNIYPQLDRDNSNSNPDPTSCFVDHNIIGNVFVNDPENSVTKEALTKLNSDFTVGLGVTGIISNLTGTSHTIYTNTDHSLSGITGVSIVSAGASYVSGTYYGVGVSTSSGGESASFKVVIDGTQRVTSVDVMSGGSNYIVGDVVSVVSGIGTTTGFVPATLSVTSVENDINQSITLSGFEGDYLSYNDTYVINSIPTSKQIVVSSSSAISGFSTTTVQLNGSGIFNGRTLSISNFIYNNVVGISTITFPTSHGVKLNSKVRLSGFTSSFYNNDVIVTSVNSLTQIEVNSGVSTILYATTGSPILIPLSLESNSGKNRVNYYYSGITTTSGGSLNSDAPDGSFYNIRNARAVGFKQGDYIESNGEIMRIKSVVSTDNVVVYRAKFGTERKTHLINSVIKKVNIIPVELRRNSIIRASGHTFEYVGYGPGNYSTALPENQDRSIGKVERLISQSTKTSGGVVYYTGMDENGDFYSGNRKLSSTTGEQEIYDLPVPTVVGESYVDESFNVLDSKNIVASDSIRVNGGENNDVISIFNGPVLFDKKVAIEDDLEVKSLYINGENSQAKNYGISDSIPLVLGDRGDLKFNATPVDGGSTGWIVTENNEWREFGPIKNRDGRYAGIWTGTFYGSFIGELSVNQPWIEDAVGIHTTKKVGIGTDTADVNYALDVRGNTNINGILHVGEIIERVTVDTSIQLGNPISIDINLGDNNVYYYTLPAIGNWGINFQYNDLQTLDSSMDVGETITIAIMTTQGATAYYNNQVTIDGVLISPFEYGNFSITEGNPNGIDMYTYVIIKKSNTGLITNNFTILRSLSQYTQ